MWPPNGSDGPTRAQPCARQDSSIATRELAGGFTHAQLLDPDDSVLEPGTFVGSYHILRQLGRGGMGTIYLARDVRLQREVALKLLLPALWRAPRALSRMRREARAMAQLSHPNVVQVYGLEESDGLLFLTMEFVRGADLRTWLELARRPQADIIDVFTQAGRGLAAAHDAGLVHRDFKPANVMVGSDGRVRVADFGLARTSADTDTRCTVNDDASRWPPFSQHGSVDLSRTTGKSIVGTPRYMAPEQLTGLSTDARADQYAFCVAFYEALTSERLFEATDSLVLKAAGPKPAQLHKLPRALRSVLEIGLSPHPDDRFESMHALLAQLNRRAWRKLPLLAPLAISPFVFWALSEREDCVAGADEIDATWNSTARASVIRTLGGHAAAPEHLERLQTALDGYARQWREAFTDVCATRSELADGVFDRQILCLKGRHRALQAQVEALLHQDAATATVDKALEAVTALPEVQRCLDPEPSATREVDDVVAPESVRSQVEAIGHELEAIRAQLRLGNVARASEQAQAALARASTSGFLPIINAARHTLAKALIMGSRYEEAATQLEQLYHDARAAHQPLLAVDAATLLAGVLGADLQRFDAAEPWLEHARAGLLGHADDHERWSALLLTESRILDWHDAHEQTATRREQALQRLSRIHGPDHPRVLDALGSLATSWTRLGQHEQALALHKNVLAAYERVYGSDHPKLYEAVRRLGGAAFYAERYDDAVAYDRRAFELHERLLGPGHFELVRDLSNLGVALKAAYRLEEAEAVLEQALELAPQALAHGQAPTVVDMRHNLANVWILRGRFDEAEAMLHRALQESPTDMVFDRVSLALSLGNLERARGHVEKAAQWYQQGWTEATKGGAAARSNPWNALCLCEYGDALAERGQVEAGSEAIEQCVDIIDAGVEERSTPLMRALFLRGKWTRERSPAPAREDLQRAVQMGEELASEFHAEAAIALADLVAVDDPARARALVEDALGVVRALPLELGASQVTALERWLARHD